MKADGTRVNPVAVALDLKDLVQNNPAAFSGTQYLQGIQVVDGSSSETPANTVTDSSSASGGNMGIVIGAVVAGIAVVVVGAIVGFIIYRKKKNSSGSGWM